MIKSRKRTISIAGTIAGVIYVALKQFGIQSPIDEALLVEYLTLFLFMLDSRKAADDKIKAMGVYRRAEVLKKWSDPGYWAPLISMVLSIASHFAGFTVGSYVIPIIGGILASYFNRKRIAGTKK
jgi:hypothetical protein